MKKVWLLLLSAVLLAGCGESKDEAVTTAQAEITTETERDYSLVRGWTMDELFSEIIVDGHSFSFPISLSEFESGGAFEACSFSDNKIYFQSGLYLEAVNYPTEENPNAPITHLKAEEYLAPADFEIYGLRLGMSYTEAAAIGIPDSVSGDPANDVGSIIFLGKGTQTFEISFDNGKINAFILTQ